MADDNERALVARCQQGNQDAFRELVEQYQGAVYGLLSRTVADRALAEDLAQETFLRVHRGLPFFRGEARLSTWIYRIVANLVAEQHSRGRLAAESLDETYEDGTLRREPGAPDGAFADLELRDAMEKAIAHLPAQYRLVVSAYYLEGLKYEELSEALGLPLGTVKTHLHRAKRMLREYLAAAPSLDGRGSPRKVIASTQRVPQ